MPEGPHDPIGPAAPAAPGTVAGAGLTWFERVEIDLLGLRSLPFGRRAELAGWAPDAAAAYCWRCGTSVGPSEADGSGCATCRGRRPPWDRWVRLGPHDGLLREGIHELKYARMRRTGRVLGRLLGRELAGRLRPLGVDPGAAAIVPMPTSLRRRLARGVDHAGLLAEAAGRASGCPVVRALARKHRPAQTGLSRSARIRNLRGAFRVSDRSLQGFRIVVILDDVRTTGATMAGACRALRGGRRWAQNGDLELWAASVAVATPSERRGSARAAAAARPAPIPRAPVKNGQEKRG